MPTNLFGSPLGQMAYNQDQQVQARTRLELAEADLQEQQAQQQRRVTQVLQESALSPSGSVGGGGSPGNPIWKIANTLLEKGLPEGIKYANAASTIDYRKAAGETQKMRVIELGNKVKTENLDLKARLLRDVPNREALEVALKDFESQTGERTGYLDREGKLRPEITDSDVPSIVGRERALAVSEKDKLLMDYRREALASADRFRTARENNYNFWQNFDNQQARERARAQGRAEGRGQDNLFPTTSQIAIGASYLATKFPNIDDKGPWARVMGLELITEAKRLRGLNSALDATEALDEAYKSLDKKGTFAAHKSAGKSDEELNIAVPLPASGKPEDLVEGQVYTDGTQQRRWSKQGWVTHTGKGLETEIRPITEKISEADARRALGTDVDTEALGLEEDDEE